jgi:hypothetical protein
MIPPTIQALGITQEGAPTRWHATGYVEGLGLAGSLGHEPGRGDGGVAATRRPAGGSAGGPRGGYGPGGAPDMTPAAQTWPRPTLLVKSRMRRQAVFPTRFESQKDQVPSSGDPYSHGIEN